MKYAFIEQHRRLWPVSVQCRVLQVSAADYQAHLVRRASTVLRRHLSDEALAGTYQGRARNQRRLRLAAHLALSGGARYCGGQGPGAKTHASQYASGAFKDALQEYGITSSMSRRGNCWDNGCSVTLFGSLKVDRLHGQRFVTRRHAKDELSRGCSGTTRPGCIRR